MATNKDIQESWYQVENTEGIQTVRSTEEIAELLADAVTEKPLTSETDESQLMEGDIPFVTSIHSSSVPQTGSVLIGEEVKSVEEDEELLTFNVSQEYINPQHQYQSPYHNTSMPPNRENTGYLNGFMYYFKDFLKSFLNPAIVASHMAMLGIGIFIGRRLLS